MPSLDFIALLSAQVSPQYLRRRTLRGLVKDPAVLKNLPADRPKQQFGAFGCSDHPNPAARRDRFSVRTSFPVFLTDTDAGAQRKASEKNVFRQLPFGYGVVVVSK